MKSIFSKSMVASIIFILITGIGITLSIYFVQEKLFLQSFQKQAVGFANFSFTTFDEEKLKADDLELVEQLDLISKKYPEIAQAYFFGAELKNGNETMIKVMPTHIREVLESDAGLTIGDYLPQPEVIVTAIKEMHETKDVVVTSNYTDDFGTWVSVLLPIKDSTGEITSYYGLDIDASIIGEAQHDILFNSLLILLGLIITVIVCQYFITKRLLTPVKEIHQAFDKVSQGDLNTVLTIKRSDELGQLATSFNSMVLKMKEIMLKVKDSSSETVNASVDLLKIIETSNQLTKKTATSMNQVASGSEAQVIRAEESANAMEEMTEGILRIATSTSSVSESSINASSKADSGKEYIENTLKQMVTIQEPVENSVAIVRDLGTKSNEIHEIVGVITRIADQTNLLALNAAIEAARAGENGKGFAVVADEVRKLAEKSTNFAKEIIKIIQETQNDTDKAVQSMDIVSSNVISGLQIVKETGNAFNDILENIKQVNDQIHEISAVSEELSAGSEQVAASVAENADLAKISGKHSIQVTESSKKQLEIMNQVMSSMNTLVSKSEDMERMIDIFKL